MVAFLKQLYNICIYHCIAGMGSFGSVPSANVPAPFAPPDASNPFAFKLVYFTRLTYSPINNG